VVEAEGPLGAGLLARDGRRTRCISISFLAESPAPSSPSLDLVTDSPSIPTMALDKPYSNIPGTTIFDADQSRRGYWLNQFAMSLMKAENRERFKANERAYLDEWKMSEDQKQAVLARDYNRMIALGGNIYFLAKIFATDGKSFQYAAALMTGMSQEDYVKMMLSGGRSPESNSGGRSPENNSGGRSPDGSVTGEKSNG